MNYAKFVNKTIQKTFGLFKLKLTRIASHGFPVDTEKEIIKFINISSQFSMTGSHRMYILYRLISYIKANKLEGDFVECGVWRGGNILLYKFLNDFYHLNKSIFGYDTFEGMTTPGEFDIDHKEISAIQQLKNNTKNENVENIHCYSSLESVSKNILKYNNLDNVHFIKGSVEKTLFEEKNLPKKISVLRLDTDWYESTKIELEILYPKLVEGGVLIIDDYGHWKGARKAVDEFFDEKKFLHYVDYSCRYLIKK